jgi:hypothetical protein
MTNEDEDLHIINFRGSAETHEQLRALAADEDRSIASWLRHVVRQRFEARFGDATPGSARATKGRR